MSALEFSDIRNQVAGHWPGILAALGIEVTARHGPCPGCGGTDRFRFDDLDGRGTFICSGGGAELLAGDGFDLVCHVYGCGVREALEMVAGALGAEPKKCTQRTTPRKPDKRSYARELWLKADFRDASVQNHPYVVRKGFECAHGGGVVEAVRSRLWSGEQSCLLVPIREHGIGKVIAVQAINPDGTKCTFGGMSAEDRTPGYLMLGNERDRQARLMVAEGWADVVSLVFLAYRGNACGAVAFGKSRLEPVAEQFMADTGRMPIIVEDGG